MSNIKVSPCDYCIYFNIRHSIFIIQYFPVLHSHITRYSVRKLLTGFATADLTACVLTVSRAITSASTPAATNTHQLIVIRYSYCCSHPFINQKASGEAIRQPVTTSHTNSFDNNIYR